MDYSKDWQRQHIGISLVSFSWLAHQMLAVLVQILVLGVQMEESKYSTWMG
jgi:hypothetical protein